MNGVIVGVTFRVELYEWVDGDFKPAGRFVTLDGSSFAAEFLGKRCVMLEDKVNAVECGNPETEGASHDGRAEQMAASGGGGVRGASTDT